MYWDDFTPGQFLDKDIHAVYPNKDYHRSYFGEIRGIQAGSRFLESGPPSKI